MSSTGAKRQKRRCNLFYHRPSSSSALGSAKVGFLVAALVITAAGTFGAAWLEKQVAVAAARGETDAGVVHLYDYVCDFGVQGLAYVIGRLWYAALTTWIDAKSISSGGSIHGAGAVPR